MLKAESKILRGEVCESPANRGKQEACFALLEAWRKTAPEVAKDLWNRRLAGGGIPNKTSVKAEHYTPHRAGLASHLGVSSEDVKAVHAQAITAQVGGMLSSMVEAAKERIKRRLRRLIFLASKAVEDVAARKQLEELGLPVEGTLPQEDLAGAFRINDWGLWDLAPELVRERLSGTSKKGKTYAPPSEGALQLARKLWDLDEERRGWPSFERIGIRLNNQVGVSLPKTAKHFDLWVSIPAVGRRPMLLPVRAPQSKQRSEAALRAKGASDVRIALRALEGTYSPSVELAKGKRGQLEVRLVRDLSVPAATWQESYKPKTERVGLDFGIKRALTDDGGNLRGTWKKGLERHDRRIRKLRAKLQSQATKGTTGRKDYTISTKRLERMLHSKRGYIKTVVGTAVHRLVEQRAPGGIVAEYLDFRGKSWDKTFTRILGSSGRTFVRQKILDVGQRLGITTEEVNPAYTSLMCSACGFPDGANRRGDCFRCRACGYKIHADVNAARNIRMRHSDGREAEASWVDKRQQLLGRLVRRWAERVLDPHKRSSAGPPVRALEALASSEYLRKKLAPGSLDELLEKYHPDRGNQGPPKKRARKATRKPGA